MMRNPKCPMCGDNPSIKGLIDYDQFCGIRGEEAPAPKATAGEMTVEELKKRMDKKENLFVLDVRNPNEWQICKIPGTVLLPLPELAQRFGELPKDREIIVHCKSGMRSAKAIQFLRERGYRNLRNLTGGILAWSEKVDPSVPRY